MQQGDILLQLLGDFVTSFPTRNLTLGPTGGLRSPRIPHLAPFEKLLDPPPWTPLEAQPQALAGVVPPDSLKG